VKIKISIDIYTGINCKHLKANFRNSLSIPVVSSTANKLRLLFTNKSKIKIKRNSIKKIIYCRHIDYLRKYVQENKAY